LGLEKPSDMNIWIILIAVMIASFIVQQGLQSRFRKYSQIPTPGRLTGAEVARKMLEENGVTNVRITCIEGQLTDHFNPETMTVNLSESVYGERSIAAAAVAAHECGHALQHAQGYAPLRLRTRLVPVVTFANKTIQWVLLLGVLLINITPALLWIGIALFAATTLFSLVTLPVEINASQRAVAWLKQSAVADIETAPMASDALKWAAYTYVIAAIGSLATLLYYIAMARRN